MCANCSVHRWLLLALLAWVGFEDSQAFARPSPIPQRSGREPLVFKDQVIPTWLEDRSHFWYRNVLADGASEFVLVDAEKGTRAAAFDHARLAAELGAARSEDVDATRLPFERIVFSTDLDLVRFKVGDQTWQFDLSSVRCEPAESSTFLDELPAVRGRGRNRDRAGDSNSRSRDAAEPVLSPDGAWSAFVKDGAVMLRNQRSQEESALSAAGEQSEGFETVEWSPDSRSVLAWRLQSVERKEVYLVRSSPEGGGRAQLETRGYSLPGDPFPTRRPSLFDVETKSRTDPEVDAFEHEWSRPRVHWQAGGRRFAYEQTDRGHQRFRVIEIDARSGAVRNLVDERTDTFVWTAHAEAVRLQRVNWLENTEEMILASERDGWRHLYLVDVESAEIRPITSGEWVVRGIERIDESARQIWFRASGRNSDQDPYFVHHYRVDFEGTELVALTEGDGDHAVQFSPDRRFLIDTYSRVDRAPVTELRRTSDGTRVCELERADITRLQNSGWQPPEVHVAKGRDGSTDIWGILVKPKDFDPSKQYPVVEDLYAGPHDSFVPKTFSAQRRYATLADLGFIVVKIDGMGTANRSKAFHDVCWHNLKDAGLPDRIRWMQAVAEGEPWMDLTRVGVFGTSAGGQEAAAAVLFHPEFYKVAVANCGCHDNRMDKASWNEQWMGYPVGPQYPASSNIENAALLEGKLFLIVGEMDTNVPPESTLRFVDALVRARKDFDFLLVPGAGHGANSGSYTVRRTYDFLVRHLQGIEPPDRNQVLSSEDDAESPR